MMPPAITGTFAQIARTQFLQDRLHQFHMASGKDRQADHMHAFFLSRLGNLLRRQPDAVVDDLEADISGLDGHLFGAIGMPVQTRFADQQLERAAERVARYWRPGS
jgi:hypothetical protein